MLNNIIERGLLKRPARAESRLPATIDKWRREANEVRVVYDRARYPTIENSGYHHLKAGVG